MHTMGYILRKLQHNTRWVISQEKFYTIHIGLVIIQDNFNTMYTGSYFKKTLTQCTLGYISRKL